MNKKDIDRIARDLFEAEKNKTTLNMFTTKYSELDVDVAYKIQKRLIELKSKEESSHLVGRKLGLTSKSKQEMMGVHEPSYGVLLSSMALDEGTVVSLDDFIHPKIEPEIAFVFKRDLDGTTVSVTDVLEATAYIAPAIEIIDSRYTDFKFTLADVIADNSSSSAFLIGHNFKKIEDVDLQLMGMVMRRNSEIIATSAGAAVMGHPARAVAWMANKLIKEGESVRAGEVVLSGALSEAFTIKSGDHFSVHFAGLGTLEVQFS